MRAGAAHRLVLCRPGGGKTGGFCDRPRPEKGRRGVAQPERAARHFGRRRAPDP